MRWGTTVSLIAHTGQSEAIHSPEACARTVLSRTIPTLSSIEVVCTVAISCWLRVLRTMSSPLDNGAYRKDRSDPLVWSDRIIPTKDFSGLTNCAWALASAAAIVPMVSLECCMVTLGFEEVEADGARFRTFGAHPVADCLLGIFWHQGFELNFGPLMIQKGLPGVTEEVG